MTGLFLDTDVLLDLLVDRPPHTDSVIRLFRQVQEGRYRCYTSATSIATAWYMVVKDARRSPMESEAAFSRLLNIVTVIPTPHESVVRAFESDFSDKEDAMQHESALAHPDVAILVTRNIRDYRHARIPVRTPSDVVGMPP